MRNRTSSHTVADWQRIRPSFTDLYITQNKPLKEVIRILDTRYGFKASPKQCKLKIEEWKIGKHCNERDALHVLRKIKRLEKQPQRGNIVVKLRGRPTGIDKVIKHFQRKDVTSIDDLLERLPRSPTPSIIDCEETEVEEIPRISPGLVSESTSPSQQLASSVIFTPSTDSLDSYLTPGIWDATPPSIFPDLSSVDTEGFLVTSPYSRSIPRTPRAMQTSMLEQGLGSLKDAIRIHVQPDQKDCNEWWETSRTIAGDLINARGHLYTGQLEFAMVYYDRLVQIATNSVKVQDMTLLQLIAHLFSWATYPQYAPLVQYLLMFLARLTSTDQQPVLSVIARSLVTNTIAPRKMMARYMECITQQLDHVLGQDCVMVLWMKVRLCRHLHAVGEIASAVRLLDQVDHIWRMCEDSTQQSLLLKMRRELGITFYQFGDFISARYHLTQALEGFHVEIGGVARKTYLLQRLAACNWELGFPELALEQARLGLAELEATLNINYPWTENLKLFTHDLEQQVQGVDMFNEVNDFFSPSQRFASALPRIIFENNAKQSIFQKYFSGDSYDATFIGQTACFDDGILAQYGETLSLCEEQDEVLNLWSSLQQLSMDRKHSQSVSLSIVDMQESTAGADLCLPDAPLKPFDD